MKKIKIPSLQGSNQRTLQSGAMAAGISVLVVALAVLLNVLVEALPTKYTEFDLSSQGLYTLSDSSIQLVKALPQKAEISYLAQTGSEDSNVVKLLDRYAGESENVSWKQVDPAINPTFAGQYGSDISAGSLIVTSGEKTRVLAQDDLYEYDMSSYYYTGNYTASFNAENAIDTALLYVTGDETAMVYQISGHGEAELDSALVSGLEAQNLSVSSVTLLSGGVPSDAAVLIINNPTGDYSADDIKEIEAFLETGGNLMVTTDPRTKTPNLAAMLAEYGMSGVDGIVVEGNESYHMRGYSYYLLPGVENADAAKGMDGKTVLAPIAGGIALDNTVSGVTLTALLSTSNQAYSKLAGADMQTYDKEEGDLNGPFSLAVSAENDATGAKLVWANFASLTDATVDGYVSGGNSTFYTSCISWMTGKEASTLVPSKSLQGETLVVNGAAGNLMGLAYVIVLPLGLLVAGIAVAIIRRRK